MSTENNDLRWSNRGWTAEVVENEDGGGWALAMTRDGNTEPTLVVPWVMGRNKKDPKPLNEADFAAQAKAAEDFVTRHEAQERNANRTHVGVVGDDGQWVRVIHEISPDEFDPEARLIALDHAEEELANVRCSLRFKLSRASALAWVNGGFQPLDDE
jgi:hypothetical protein